MLTPKVVEVSRVSCHRRQVELVRASILSGVVLREEQARRVRREVR
jgi:hypothetical protein